MIEFKLRNKGCKGFVNANGTGFNPRKLPVNVQTATSRMHALLAGLLFCNTHELPVVIAPARS